MGGSVGNERSGGAVEAEAGLGAALGEALLVGDGAAVARLTARLDPPGPTGAADALLDAAQAWPGEEAAAALREAAEAIAGFDITDLLGRPPPSWLARLFGAEHPMRQARRRHAESVARLAPVEVRLADGLARLDAGLLRLDRARAAAAAQLQAVGALLAEADRALAATASHAAALREGGDAAAFPEAEAAAKFLGQREAIEVRREELAVACAAAGQAVAAAALLAARDRSLAAAIRRLCEEALPHWHLQVAEAIALLNAAGAIEAMRGVGGATTGAGGALVIAAREATLDAIRACRAALPGGVAGSA